MSQESKTEEIIRMKALNHGLRFYSVYMGTSMNPVLREPELMEVIKVPANKLRKGDVILFRSPEKAINVVHRVIAINEDIFRTQGDNSLVPDSYTVDSHMILGRVVAAYRGQRRRVICGGLAGQFISMLCRIRKKILIRAGSELSLVYNSASKFVSPVIFSFLPKTWLPRVVSYPPHVACRYQLFIGKKLIGRLDASRGEWLIIPPYKLLVDVSRLPFLE